MAVNGMAPLCIPKEEEIHECTINRKNCDYGLLRRERCYSFDLLTSAQKHYVRSLNADLC